MSFVVIIPARYNSTRLPGKPLRNICGLPMIERVWHQACQSGAVRVIIATGECGYRFDFETQTPDEFDVDLYEYDSMKELAEQFVEEGLFGEIPENIQHYLDYEKIAYDLSMDYSETTIAGQRLIYRCS